MSASTKDMGDKKVIKLLCLGVFLAVLATLYCITAGSLHSDFIEFYAAAHALKAGKNPYDPSVMLLFQKEILHDVNLREALMLWSPPWILSLMAPWGFEYEYASSLESWRFLAILFTAAALYLCFRAVFNDEKNWSWKIVTATAASLLCAPLLDAMKLNQSAPIFLVSMAIFILAWLHGNSFIKGMMVAVFLLKPHLFFLVLLLWIVHESRNQRFPKAISGLSVGLLILIGISELLYPGGTRYWLGTFMFTEDSHDTVPRASWVCATLPGILRAYLGIQTPILSILIPGMTSVVFLWTLLKSRISLNLPYDFSWIIPLTLFTAPYGWTFDQSLCTFSSFLVIFSLLEDRRLYRVCAYFAVWNGVAAWFYLFVAHYQHELWWYTLGPLLISLGYRRFACNEFSNP